MLFEEVEIEFCKRGERILHIRVEVHCNQAARVVWAQRNLTARIGAHSSIAQICIAVGHRLSKHCIPEQHAWLCRFPCIVDNLLPQLLCADHLLNLRLIAVYRVLLLVLLSRKCSSHEFIVNLYRYICTGNFSLLHLCINECLRIRMLD